MEKVKLTPEQAEAIEKWKGMANNKQILHAFIGNGKEYGWLDELECLKSLSFDEMALVLCGWYEIAAEKERRKWALLGRKVGEYKGGDIVAIKDELWVVTSVDQEAGFDEIWCQSFGGEISECYSAKDIQALVCPFHNRFDLINI